VFIKFHHFQFRSLDKKHLGDAAVQTLKLSMCDFCCFVVAVISVSSALPRRTIVIYVFEFDYVTLF
jgi:hypothetical protein